jgi:hypothetical protein
MKRFISHSRVLVPALLLSLAIAPITWAQENPTDSSSDGTERAARALTENLARQVPRLEETAADLPDAAQPGLARATEAMTAGLNKGLANLPTGSPEPGIMTSDGRPVELPAGQGPPDSPPVPALPEVPVGPALPDLPDLPEVVNLPDLPEVPDVLNIPDVPVLPELPDVPETPVLPDIPDVPEAANVP